MRVVTILCFSYPDSPLYLGASYVDLYLVYTGVLRMKPDLIRVFTDLTQADEESAKLRRLIASGIISGETINLIETIKERGEYIYYKDFSQIISWLNQVLWDPNVKPREHLFYFSGHGVNEHLVFPGPRDPSWVSDSITKDGIPLAEGLGMDLLIEILQTNSRGIDQTMMLLDCCFCHTGKHFPYVYSEGEKCWNQLSDYGEIKASSHPILCWYSTRYSSGSIMTEDGSFFTRAFFRHLRYLQDVHHEKKKPVDLDFQHFYRNILSICRDSYGQSLSLFSNTEHVTRVWLWLVGMETDIWWNPLEKTWHIILSTNYLDKSSEICPSYSEKMAPVNLMKIMKEPIRLTPLSEIEQVE